MKRSGVLLIVLVYVLFIIAILMVGCSRGPEDKVAKKLSPVKKVALQ